MIEVSLFSLSINQGFSLSVGDSEGLSMLALAKASQFSLCSLSVGNIKGLSMLVLTKASQSSQLSGSGGGCWTIRKRPTPTSGILQL